MNTTEINDEEMGPLGSAQMDEIEAQVDKEIVDMARPDFVKGDDCQVTWAGWQAHWLRAVADELDRLNVNCEEELDALLNAAQPEIDREIARMEAHFAALWPPPC